MSEPQIRTVDDVLEYVRKRREICRYHIDYCRRLELKANGDDWRSADWELERIEEFLTRRRVGSDGEGGT